MLSARALMVLMPLTSLSVLVKKGMRPHQLAVARLSEAAYAVAGFADDGLHGGGGDVIVGIRNDEAADVIADMKLLCNLLLVTPAIVATAHFFLLRRHAQPTLLSSEDIHTLPATAIRHPPGTTTGTKKAGLPKKASLYRLDFKRKQ